MCPSVCLSVSQCVLHIVDLTSFHQPYTYRLGVCTRMSCVLHLTFIFVFTPSEIRVKQNFSSNIRRKKNDGRIKTGEMTKKLFAQLEFQTSKHFENCSGVQYCLSSLEEDIQNSRLYIRQAYLVINAFWVGTSNVAFFSSVLISIFGA